MKERKSMKNRKISDRLEKKLKEKKNKIYTKITIFLLDPRYSRLTGHFYMTKQNALINLEKFDNFSKVCGFMSL